MSGATTSTAAAGETRQGIEITVNGETRRTTAATLDALIAAEGYGDIRVATAVNGDFVPASRRTGTHLAAGDRIEIVSARQGG